MNGEYDSPLTGREMREQLREVAAERRASALAWRDFYRKEKIKLRILQVICLFSVMFSVTVISLSAWSFWSRHNQVIEGRAGLTLAPYESTVSVVCLPRHLCPPDAGWYRPGYTDTMEEVGRFLLDQWRLGEHLYSTRDLMGRGV